MIQVFRANTSLGSHPQGRPRSDPQTAPHDDAGPEHDEEQLHEHHAGPVEHRGQREGRRGAARRNEGAGGQGPGGHEGHDAGRRREARAGPRRERASGDGAGQ